MTGFIHGLLKKLNTASQTVILSLINAACVFIPQACFAHLVSFDSQKNRSMFFGTNFPTATICKELVHAAITRTVINSTQAAIT
jgi:hypothetical protein